MLVASIVGLSLGLMKEGDIEGGLDKIYAFCYAPQGQA